LDQEGLDAENNTKQFVKEKEYSAMKIVYIGDFDSPHTYILAEHFIDFYDYKIFAFSEYEPTEKDSKIKYSYIFPLRSEFSIKEHFKELILRILKKVSLKLYYIFRIYLFKSAGLFKEMNDLKPDIVHAHFCSDNGRIAYYSGFKPYIVSCWGSDLLIHPEKSRYLKNEIQNVLQNASYIHSCANQLTSKIKNDFNITEDKIIEIQYGLKPQIIQYLGDREIGISDNRIIKIICTRAAKSVYDNESIILAAKIMQTKGLNIEIKMFTDGPLFKNYQKMISKLNLKNFSLLHNLKHIDLYDEYKKSDIYLSASISDGLSISLIEAFSSKLYPIVSDIEANRNVIHHKENGLLFKINSPESIVKQITYILSNRNHLSKTIELNYQWVLHNQNLVQNLNEINEIYKMCIKTSRENI
jgi:L-malate glycosyltransferase